MMIRMMKPEDERPLRKLVMRYLKETYEAGGEILPTLENAATSVNYAIEGAAVNDPCLIAEEDNKIVGYTVCRGVYSPGITTRYKTIRTWGTYVLPEYRSKNVATALLVTAGRIAKIAGYERFMGITYGSDYAENGEHVAKRIRGMKEVGKVLIMNLTRPAREAEEKPTEGELH